MIFLVESSPGGGGKVNMVILGGRLKMHREIPNGARNRVAAFREIGSKQVAEVANY